jgi:hypothetical protein
MEGYMPTQYFCFVSGVSCVFIHPAKVSDGWILYYATEEKRIV